ncbi:MAG: hypothetical protein WCO02_18230 [Bacteroidota bacterium]
MKKLIETFLITLFFVTFSQTLYSQADQVKQDFGISVGGFTNFPANQNYLTDYMSVMYVAPYIQVGRHEFSVGMTYPVSTQALFFQENDVNPYPGAIASYKFYVFNPYGRENMFIHYSFQYLRFKRGFEVPASSALPADYWTETDMYINNVIGLGYNIYFDMEERFGLYYTLDYVISQTSYNLHSSTVSNHNWNTQYVWNNISTHIGFIFKLTPLKKKVKK